MQVEVDLARGNSVRDGSSSEAATYEQGCFDAPAGRVSLALDAD